MDWQQRILEALRNSRGSYDDRPDWRAALTLYGRLGTEDQEALDRTFVAMISDGYRNPHSDHGQLPFDDVMVNLPAGMRLDDLLCIEAAVMVAAERGLGSALFAFNRLMRTPRWHALYPRLEWLPREGGRVHARLTATAAGRYLGAMVGLGVGDALGVTLESMSRRQVRHAFPDGHTDILGGGALGRRPGEWTDDTDMALAVANGIADSPADPMETVGKHFVTWFQTGPPDVGETTALALTTYLQTSSWERTEETVARELGNRNSSNGALMRTLPTPLAYGHRTEQAVRIARMTHPHADSDAAVTAYHLLIDAVVRCGVGKEEALEAAARPDGPLTERLTRVPSLAEEDVRSTRHVVDTLEAALWAFLTTDSFETCVVRAVNLGEDADTVGALAGGLAGAYYGADAIPRRWSTVLRERQVLEQAAERLWAVAHL